MVLIEDNKIEKQVTFIKRCQMKIQLSKEQDAIVGSSERILIVKGTAGSGKTLVGLARAEMILEDQARSLFNKHKKVLFLSYNNSIINELKDKNREYCDKKFSESIEFKTYDKLFYSLVKGIFLQEHSEYKISTFNKEYFCKEEPYKSFMKNMAVELNQDEDFLIDEIRYIMYNGFSKEEYVDVVRNHRKGRLNKAVRKNIYDVLIKYRHMLKKNNKIDIYDAYNWFLTVYLKDYKDKDYAKDIEMDQVSSETVTDDSDLQNKKRVNLFQIFSNIEAIIVDESQDLCRLKIRTLQKIMEIFDDIHYLTFLYDISQSIYESSYFNSITSFKSIGINARKSVKTLGFSYRSTRQIHQCAYSLLSNYSDKDDANELVVNPIFGQSDEGIKPMLLESPTIEAESKFIIKIVKVLLKKYNYTMDDIIIISQNAEEEKSYKTEMCNNGIDSVYISSKDSYSYNKDEVSARDANKGKIRIYNPYNVKGLESKIIFMVGNNSYNENKPDEEIAKYYYVQMTRAMELLFILSVGEANKFIQSIDENYLSKLEYGDNLNIEEIIDSNIKIQKAMIESNKLPRYTGVEENLEKKTKLEKEYQKKLEQKEKDLQNSNISGKLTIEDYDKKVREEMGELPDEVLKNIALGLYYSEQIMDIETAYGKYAKALELVLKEIYKDTVMTLGEMVHNLEDNKDYKQFAKEIIKLGFIKIRNLAIHSSLDINNKKDLLVIQDYIFKDKKLVKLYDKILAVKERDDNKNPISKIGSLITKGCKSKIHGKELYLYLIDNEEFGACSRLVKDGVYEMNGKYQQSNGKDIFIIDSYKCCKEPEITIQ